MKSLILALSILAPAAMSFAQTDAQRIAERYGIQNFGNVEALRYTFNVARNGETVVERSWVWHPKTDSVEWVDESKKYERDETSDPDMDQKFINDQYWLLFPFHLVWDDNVKIEEHGSSEAPISKESLNKLTITYQGEHGYTPGDAYDLFYNNDYLVREWIFRKGAQADGRPMTWSDEVDKGGVVIATEHESPDGSTRLWFSGIEVEE